MTDTGHYHDVEDYERVYATGRQWSGNPNDAVVRHVGALTSDTAVDIGCGEGADAVWLATQGWRVTAVDPSPTAISRTVALARDRQVEIETIVGDQSVLDGRTFGLVSVCYVPVTAEMVEAIRSLVAPGGRLLYVHHADHGGQMHHRIMAPYALADCGEHWQVEVRERAARHVTGGAGQQHRLDEVVMLRRPR